MVSTLKHTAAKALWVLAPLWIFQGCVLVRTQSHPAQDDLAVYATPETPARAGPEVSHPPESTTADGPFSAEREASAYVHVVRWNGETLSLISLWYTGSWQNWKGIAKANPGIDPKRIRIGDKIRIPESLLKKREPLPLDWVSPPPPQRSPPTRTRGESAPAAEEEVDLFGPVEAAAHREPTPKDIDLSKPAEIPGKRAEPQGQTGLFGPVE